MEVIDKSKLKPGDLIMYHDWFSGGFLFGIIVEHEDEYYHNKLNIWRSPSSIHWLQAVDAIEIIEKIEDVKHYKLHDFHDFLSVIKEHNIQCNFDFEEN